MLKIWAKYLISPGAEFHSNSVPVYTPTVIKK